MRFLPYENIIYKTQLSETEILNKLLKVSEPEKTFRFSLFGIGSDKLYEGYIYEHGFDIKRLINYHNSFQPRINGVIQKEFDGTIIKIKMQLHPAVIVFVSFFCFFTLIISILILSTQQAKSEFDFASLVPLGMTVFAYLIMMVGFKYESYKSKEDFEYLFQAEIIEQK